VQTQMSFLFLTGDYVYKVKKPVDLGYLDYTTLEKRRFFCRQEVELNRRLSPDIYLEVVPVVRNEWQIRIGGKGETIEYAVKMRQLPREQMMDNLLPQNRVTEEMVVNVAEKLATFHDKAVTSPEISAYGGLDAITKFNDRFRYGDVASEVAFLAMDIDRYQRADLSQAFVNAYVRLTHDKDLLQLLNFYKCYRAYVRGKVESFKFDDPYISQEEKTGVLAAARRYFELAESYT